MPLFRARSFQGRIFVAILFVVLVPAAATVGGGALMLSSIGTRSGTLGAWDAVASTGQDLLDVVGRASATDPELRSAAERHREALSESVRMSRLYSFVAERAVDTLPLVAMIAGLVIGALAYFTARWLSRDLGRPVAELAGWTELIAHGEALPPDSGDAPTVRELAALRVALRRMAEEVQENSRKDVENARMRSWTNLARRVAHEIKNPLTPMRMAAVSLGRGKTGAEAEAAGVLLEEIQRLDDLARTFSQYGRIPEGPRSPVDLGELLASLASQHATGAVPIHVRAPVSAIVVRAHYDALERAFRNLVLNAVEAQEAGGGRLDVEVGIEEGMAVVALSDRGPGIPPELLEEIWNPDVTTKARGTGLGLAIVRQTVAHHGGRAEVSNRPDGGARFEIRLPITAETSAVTSPHPPA